MYGACTECGHHGRVELLLVMSTGARLMFCSLACTRAALNPRAPAAFAPAGVDEPHIHLARPPRPSTAVA